MYNVLMRLRAETVTRKRMRSLFIKMPFFGVLLFFENILGLKMMN